MDTGFSNLNATDFSNLPYSNKTMRIADVERNRLLDLQPEEINIYNLNISLIYSILVIKIKLLLLFHFALS